MPNKHFISKLTKLIAILIIFGSLVFLNPKNIFSPIKEVLLLGAYPFQKTSYFLSKKTSNFFSLLGSISNLRKDNEELLKENAKLLSQVSDLNQTKKENEELRQQLDLLPKEEFELEGAFVIGQDPRGNISWVMLDKGRLDGVEKGMPVVVSDKILVGKIEEVFEKSAKAVLLTDSNSSINVIDLETGAKGILRGQYNLGLSLDMVEQREVLNVGDSIVTSGLGGTFPKGFLIGKIDQVDLKGDKLFQEAQIRSSVRYEDLNVVFVVK